MRRARIIRQKKGLSVMEVYDNTRIMPSHLGSFERGDAGLGMNNLFRLAKLYGVSVEELVEEVDGNDSQPEDAQEPEEYAAEANA